MQVKPANHALMSPGFEAMIRLQSTFCGTRSLVRLQNLLRHVKQPGAGNWVVGLRILGIPVLGLANIEVDWTLEIQWPNVCTTLACTSQTKPLEHHTMT